MLPAVLIVAYLSYANNTNFVVRFEGCVVDRRHDYFFGSTTLTFVFVYSLEFTWAGRVIDHSDPASVVVPASRTSSNRHNGHPVLRASAEVAGSIIGAQCSHWWLSRGAVIPRLFNRTEATSAEAIYRMEALSATCFWRAVHWRNYLLHGMKTPCSMRGNTMLIPFR